MFIGLGKEIAMGGMPYRDIEPERLLEYSFLAEAGDDMVKAVVRGATPGFARTGDGTGFNRSGLLVTASDGDPRFTFDPATGQSLGLRITGSRENIILDSENLFSTTNWTGATVVRAENVAVAPDGTTTADSWEDNSTGALEFANQAVTIAGDDTATYTASIFIKKDSDETRFPELLLKLTGGTEQNIGVDLNTSTGATAVRFSTGTVDSGVIDAGDYWRLWATVTNNNTGNTSAIILSYPAIGDVLGSFNVAAVGTAIYWGVQLEVGSFPTSYIKTTTAAVTRNAETCSIALPAALATGPFVWKVKGRTAPGIGTTDQWFGALDNNAATNTVYIYRDTSRVLRCFVWNNVAVQANLNLGVVADDTDFAVAFRVEANNFGASLNGGAIVTDTSGTLEPGLVTKRFGRGLASTVISNATIAYDTMYDGTMSDDDVEGWASS